VVVLTRLLNEELYGGLLRPLSIKNSNSVAFRTIRTVHRKKWDGIYILSSIASSSLCVHQNYPYPFEDDFCTSSHLQPLSFDKRKRADEDEVPSKLYYHRLHSLPFSHYAYSGVWVMLKSFIVHLNFTTFLLSWCRISVCTNYEQPCEIILMAEDDRLQFS
jgi:hypothetical protein